METEQQTALMECENTISSLQEENRAPNQQRSTLCNSTMDEFYAIDATTTETIEPLLTPAKMLEQTYPPFSESLRASQEKLASTKDQLSSDVEA